MSNDSSALIILKVAFYVALIAAVWAFSRFRQALERKHQAVWAGLGRPTVVPSGTTYWRPYWALLGFVWERRYRALGDDQLNRLATAYWAFLGVALIVALAVYVLGTR